jgi:toxin ParE1/3/4
MARKLRILREASAEFDESAIWYEKQSCGRGSLFSEAIVEMLDRILAQPDFFPKVRGQIREARLLNYPFCVYYKEIENGILVLSIFHTSRNPEIWQQRDS